ncbi:class I SAM-dependent methyltransferase [Rhodopirellula sallentina]|uniref:Ubiquinone/menaquinone biosynthesis methyltransferase n=1 Tax=Rhodopirellula sallentina SM41 TaxID=1263870 RepID=M5UJT4_9BACT|nr:class I SAM-dependent methyltransferase [Rhodopirellula sallentina]EMI58116.1 ubiquinone/menaquinone biosynthesis methyltransferase [Rhodopirellula sallentina SM41]
MKTSSNDEPIYDSSFVRKLFDEMSATYGIVNLVSSFGFCERWRRQCVEQVEIPAGAVVVDLMAGMGELYPRIVKRLGTQQAGDCRRNERGRAEEQGRAAIQGGPAMLQGRVVAIENSSEMCRCARELHRRRRQDGPLTTEMEIHEVDALRSGLPDGFADVVVSSFGLKTLSNEQLSVLAHEVRRILAPQGQFSFLEISVPQNRWLRTPYLFYLTRIIPVIGRLFMGNPDNYRMLSVYTTAFEDCERAKQIFEQAGLTAQPRSYFFGCATGVVGGCAET